MTAEKLTLDSLTHVARRVRLGHVATAPTSWGSLGRLGVVHCLRKRPSRSADSRDEGPMMSGHAIACDISQGFDGAPRSSSAPILLLNVGTQTTSSNEPPRNSPNITRESDSKSRSL